MIVFKVLLESRYYNVIYFFNLTGADVNMAGTMDNETPLETAVNSSNARCVKEIIQMYPKQLHVQVGLTIHNSHYNM